MDGVATIRGLLVAAAGVTGLAPAARIQAGVLPEGTELPAISIESVSKVDRNVPYPGARRHVSERVQVTVLASGYPQMKALLRAVRHAAADTLPTVAGLQGVAVHTDSAGPDFMNEDASIYLGSQDFRVQYSEER